MIVEISVLPGPPGAGGDRDQRGDRRARVGDERLLAVDHPLAAAVTTVGPLVEHRGGAGAAGVAAGVGLGQAEAPERAAGAEVGQPLLALRLGAEPEDRRCAQPDGRLQRDGHRLVDPGELLDGDAQGGQVGAAAPVLLGEGDAEQAQVAHLAHGVDGERVVAVPRLGVRCDLALGEVANDLAERLLLRGELHVHPPEVTRRRSERASRGLDAGCPAEDTGR